MSNLAVDVILGDEMRAAQTIGDYLSGRPVSASSAADAAITIGSDALMLVPGLGSAVAAVKAGRAVRTAAKGAKAVANAKRAQETMKSTKWAKEAVKKGNITKVTVKDAKRYDKAARAKKSADNIASRAHVSLGMEGNPGARAFATRGKLEKAKRDAMRQKRNSPRRKKMRYTGNVISTTKDVMDYARYRDMEE